MGKLGCDIWEKWVGGQNKYLSATLIRSVPSVRPQNPSKFAGLSNERTTDSPCSLSYTALCAELLKI